MNFCNDLLRELFDFVGGDYISHHSVSKQWKEVIQKKMDKEETLWNVLFPGVNTLHNCPLNVPVGTVKTDKNIFKNIQHWLKKYIKINYRLLEQIPLYSKVPGELFTEEWRQYFELIRDTINQQPLYKLLGLVKYFNGEGGIGCSRAENLFAQFKFGDREDTDKMQKLRTLKNWICWGTVYDDDQLLGYMFQELLWIDLEKMYSYLSGEIPRPPPDFLYYISEEDEMYLNFNYGVTISDIKQYS